MVVLSGLLDVSLFRSNSERRLERDFADTGLEREF
jgi:hypothetical protein